MSESKLQNKIEFSPHPLVPVYHRKKSHNILLYVYHLSYGNIIPFNTIVPLITIIPFIIILVLNTIIPFIIILPFLYILPFITIMSFITILPFYLKMGLVCYLCALFSCLKFCLTSFLSLVILPFYHFLYKCYIYYI